MEFNKLKNFENPHTKTAEFYDEFSKKLVSDYISGNPRVKAQLAFFEAIVDKSTKSILVVGCGIGDVTYKLAQKYNFTKVVGVDISTQNINTAKKLFSGTNLEFRCLNIITDTLDDKWDLVLFPDVYEHIPTSTRSSLHESLSQILSKNGACAFTCPTVEHQAKLRKSGEELQIVDEDVTLKDLDKLANDVGARLVFFSYICVWSNGDYFHSLISRGVDNELKSIQVPYCQKVRETGGLFHSFYERLRRFKRRKYIISRLGEIL